MTTITLNYQSNGANKTISELQKLQAAFGSTADGSIALARTLSLSLKEARAFAKSLGVTTDTLAGAANRIKQLESVGANAGEQFSVLSKEFGISRTQFLALSRQIEAGEQRLAQLNKGVSGTRKAFNSLVDVLKEVGLSSLGLQGLLNIGEFLLSVPASIVEVTAAFDGLLGSLEFASSSAEEAEKNFEFLQEQAAKLRQPLFGLQESFIQLAQATKGTQLEGEITRKLFEDSAQAATVYGSSVDELQGVFLAYQQILSAGRVTLEDFGQITERIPGALALAAEAAGVTTTQFRDLVSRGLIPAEEFVLAFSDTLARATDDGVANIPSLESELVTLQGAFTNLAREFGTSFLIPGLTEFVVVLRDLTKEATPVASLLGQTLSGALRVAADNIELLTAISLALVVQFNRQAIAAAAATIATRAKAASQLALAIATGKANAAQAQQIVLLRQQAGAFAASAAQAGLLAAAFAAIAVNIQTFNQIREASENARQGIEGATEALKDLERAQLQGEIIDEDTLGGDIEDILAENERQIREGVGAIQQVFDFFRKGLLENVIEAVDALDILPESVERVLRRIADLLPNFATAGDAAIAEQEARFSDLINTSDEVIRAYERLRNSPEGLSGIAEEELEAIRGALESSLNALENENVVNSDQLAFQQQYIELLENVQSELNSATGAEGDYRSALQDSISATQGLADATRSRETTIAETSRALEEGTAVLNEQLASRLISQEEFNDQLLALEQQGLRERLNANREAIAELNKVISSGTLQDGPLQDAQDQLTELETETFELRSDIARNTADARIAEEERAKKELERIVEETRDAIALAETERLTEIQRQLNEGVISQEQADQQRIDSTRERLEAELQAEEQQLARLRAAAASGDEEAKDALSDSLQNVAQLQLDLLENEATARQAVTDQAIQQIRDRSAAEQIASDRNIRNLEAEAQAQQLQEESIQRQSALLDARANLQAALGDLAQARADVEIGGLREALSLTQRLETEENSRVERVIRARLRELGIRGDAEDIQDAIAQAEEEQARKALQQLEQQQQFERESFRFQQQSNELAAQRAVTEARIAQLRAQSDVIQAQADLEAAQQITDPQERERQTQAAQAQLEAAQQIASLSGEQVGAAEQQLESVRDIAAIQQDTLDAQQEAARVQAEQAVSAAEFATELTRAEEATAAIADNLNSISTGSGGISLGIDGRRMGGPVAAGTPYIVGEGPGGRIGQSAEVFMPGVSGRILANKELRRALAATQYTPSAQAISMAGFSRPNTSNPLLTEMKALRKDLKRLPTGQQFFGPLNMPQTIQLERDEDSMQRAIANHWRQFTRDIQSYRGRRF